MPRGNFLYKKVGANISKYRKRKGWSQEELSFESYLHRSYIQRIETGRANPSLKTLYKIARALKITITALVEGL